MYFHQTVSTGAFWDKEERFKFGDQKVKVQGDVGSNMLENALLVQCVLAVYVRVCIIRSVDGTNVTAYTVHECEGSTRMGARPRRYIFTGHSNGSIQVCQCMSRVEIIANLVFDTVTSGMSACCTESLTGH